MWECYQGVAVSVVPSPQLIVYLFALPVALILSVTANPAPPTSPVKSTSLTKVLFEMFSIVSLGHQ